jgi:hypothetical protein
MNRPHRRTIFLVGRPGCGKTATSLRITDRMIMHPGFDSVFVLDPLEQHSVGLNASIGDLEEQLDLLEEDEERVRRAILKQGSSGIAARKHDGPIVRSVEEYDEFCALFAAETKSTHPTAIPRRVVWRCGPQPENYGPAIAEACDQGHVVLQLCESKLWYPPYQAKWPIHELPGRPDVTMEHLITMGRASIRNRDGEWCPVHMILDAQSFMMVHWEVRQNVDTVMVSQIRGNASYAVLNREFGDGTGELAERIRKLERYEWIAACGELPELAPYRGGGRR